MALPFEGSHCFNFCRFGPLPADVEYSVTAEKIGYVLSKEAQHPFNFQAFKLAEVAVHVSFIYNVGGILCGLYIRIVEEKFKDA